MSTTIDSLDIRIDTSAGDSAVNIERLATSLERLKNSSKLTSTVNNLNKLATALSTLNTATSSLKGVKRLQNLATALSGLGNIQKLSGLNSALNTLKKLPDIMDKLDATALEKFRKQMEKLADALAPLATRITEVANGFARLPNRISSAVTATNRMASATRDTGTALGNLDLFATISNFESLLHVINLVADAFTSVISQAMEWDGIQYRFGRAFGEDAEETYEYIQKINEELGINIQEFMKYSGMYGSLLSGFGLSQDKVSTISIGLSELTYDLWAANNDVVKAYEDVATAVKSAITGEIEPIRNLGIAMTEASLQEFIDQTHLAGISIEKLSEAQKAEVRYAAMVNGAMNQGIIGTYAREMHTAEGAVRSLSQSFKGLVQALGSLFIPMLQLVIPYVTAFVEILTDAIRAVAAFFGIELFKIDWGESNKGVGDIADGATEAATGLGKASKEAKKLRDYTMGFDELNVINPDSGSAGSGGGAGGAGAGATDWGTGLDLDTLWDDSVFAEASKRVDEIKEKILGFMDEWKWTFAAVGAALTGLALYKSWGTILEWGSKISGAFKTVMRVFNEFRMGMNGASFAPLYTWISKIVSGIRTFSGLLTLPVWAGFAVILGSIVSVVIFLYENWNEVTEAVKKFFKENIVPKLQEIKKHIDKVTDALGPFGKIFEKIGSVILKGVGKAFEIVGGIIFSTVGGVIATAFNVLVAQIENTIQIFSGVVQIVSGVIELVVAIFKNGDVGAAWEKIWDGVVDVAKGVVGLVTAPVIELVNGIVGWFSNLYTELTGKKLPDIVKGVKDWFAKLPAAIDEKLEEAGEFVKDFFKVSEWKKKVTDVIDTIKKNFKMPSFPSIKLTVTWDKNVGKVKTAVYKALGLDGFPKLKWSTYETGGFPAMGEAFIARENGPELVGRIGSKSAVANNDQIVTAIAQGVYEAMIAANGNNNGNGGSQNINVYLDSRQIHASVKRTDESRGANIMGNQLGYLY